VETVPTPVLEPRPVLSEAMGWLVVVGFGAVFTLLTHYLGNWETRRLGGGDMTSEHFNTGGRGRGWRGHSARHRQSLDIHTSRDSLYTPERGEAW
jgi:hypothetical protein